MPREVLGRIIVDGIGTCIAVGYRRAASRTAADHTHVEGEASGLVAPQELARLDADLRALAVVDRHPQVRALLAGHVHQEFDAQRGAVRLLATPSTCAQFAPRTPGCVMDRRPPGYRWLSLLEDGTLETRVEWLPALVGEPRGEDEARR